jgi:hypothetical protein
MSSVVDKYASVHAAALSLSSAIKIGETLDPEVYKSIKGYKVVVLDLNSIRRLEAVLAEIEREDWQ